MKTRGTAVVLVVVAAGLTLIASGPTSPAASATVSAVVYPTLFHCAASGDDACVSGQVDPSDPTLAPSSQSNTNASAATVVSAGNSYLDPRMGTANSTSGQAAAQVGVLRAGASAAVSSLPPLGSDSPNLMRLETTAAASFFDELTILPSDPGLLGTTGTVTASFVIHGSLNASQVNGRATIYRTTMGFATWELSMSAGRTLVKTNGYRFVDTSGGLGPEAMVRITKQVVFGTPFGLSVSFQARAVATVAAGVVQPLTYGLTTASADAFYMSTASWNGIQSVKAGNQILADFTVVSSSGADYANALGAPELSIDRKGTSWVLSWPISFPGYALESTSAVDSGAWSGAGSPAESNQLFQVTYPWLPDARFFRLRRLP